MAESDTITDFISYTIKYKDHAYSRLYYFNVQILITISEQIAVLEPYTVQTYVMLLTLNGSSDYDASVWNETGTLSVEGICLQRHSNQI